MRYKTLFNWGSYDVDNFGDLLFPFVVEYHLGARYRDIIHVSPTGTRSRWPDAVKSITVREALSATTAADLVVGGGNLISWTASSSINYVEDQAFAAVVHPSFSWVPYIMLVKYGIPYAYNMIGVAKRLPVEKRGLVKLVIEPASFLSCRDDASAAYLREAGVTSPIAVGVDSAIDIALVFPRSAMTRHYREKARRRYGIPYGWETAVVHVKQRYLKDEFDELSKILALLSMNRIHPILMPLGLCHKDDVVLNDPRLTAPSATCITKPELLVDMLSIIASSKYYIGSSLHGAIASLSYGNSVAVVADEEASGLCKFSGFLSQIGLSGYLHSSWKAAYSALIVHGLYTFGTMGRTTASQLTNRRYLWYTLYGNLQVRKRIQHASLWVEQSVQEHYGI